VSATEVTAMSLSSRDGQALEAIEDELAASDQELASMLAMFTRLTVGEAMPVRETVQGGCPSVARSRRSARLPRDGSSRTAVSQRGKLLMALWVLVSVTLIAVAAVISRGAASPCTVRAAPGCAGHHVAHVHQA
jgi:hypothetical protein